MADKLKIYACSGIGELSNADQPVKYWTDDTNTISNTQAVNTLLAKINSLYIQATRLLGLSREEKVDLLCDIDVLSVALDAAKRFTNDADKLHRAGEIIGVMANKGDFDFDSLDAGHREEHLHDLIVKANESYDDDMPVDGATAEWMSWWKENVEDRNVVGLNFGQQQNIRKAIKASMNGIGAVDDSWMQNADLAQYLTKGSEYFLYTYFTDEQISKLPAIFKVKRNKQWRTYDYCKALFVDIYGSEDEMQEIIRAGIIDYFQDTPENICDDIVKNKRGAIGLTGAEIVALVTAAISAVVALITAICECVAKTNVAKYGSLDSQIVETSVPDGSDWDELSMEETETESSSWIKFAAIGAAILLLFKK